MAILTTTRRAKKDSGFTTDCYCFRVELKDGTVLRFTDHQADLTTSLRNSNGTEVGITAVTYASVLPFDVSAISQSENSPNQIDLEAVVGPFGYSREQLSQGIFEDARIYLFITDYNRPVEDEEKLITGFWGETTVIDGRFVTKFSSLLSIFEVDTTRVFSQFCDAKLGGDRCGVKMTAGPRTSDQNTTFDPMTDLLVPAVVWLDATDPDVLQLDTLDRVIAWTSKGSDTDVVYFGSGTASSRPDLSTINGQTAVDLTDTNKNLVYVNQSIASYFTTHDIFVVAESYNGDTAFGLFSNANQSTGLGYYAEQGSTDTDFSHSSAMSLGIVDSDLQAIPTRGDLWTALQSPQALCYTVKAESNEAFTQYSELLGRIDSTAGLKVSEILIYPQLEDRDRQKVFSYLNSKYSLGTTSLILPEGSASSFDARNRRVTSEVGVDYLWFEATKAGTLGPTSPFTSVPLNTVIVDGDAEWTAVPARVIEVTSQADQGQTSLVNINETLPADFTDIYQSGKLEFITGPNAGLSYTIVANDLTSFSINVPTLLPTTAGDTVRITIACDKDSGACRQRFLNYKNFQGFPDLPTSSNIFKIGEK